MISAARINASTDIPGGMIACSRLTVTYSIVDESSNQWSERTMSYERSADSSWVPASLETEKNLPINVKVKERFDEPPTLVATDEATEASRVILDPNPQLQDIDLGEASVFKWKDGSGHDWVGGLYK